MPVTGVAVAPVGGVTVANRPVVALAATVSGSSWMLLVFYAMAASVWTVWLWMTGLKSVPAASAGVFTVMLPISAALVGVFVLGETLTSIQLLAFSIALMGVLLATLPSGRTVTPAP